MKSYIKIPVKILREFIALTRYYSLFYAFYNVIWWLCFYVRTPLSWRLSSWALKKKTYWLDAHIEKEYADIIQRYQGRQEDTQAVENPRIWVFWGQGEAAMPPLIRACYQQLCRHHDNVTLVTNDNVRQFLDLSPVIYEKVETGKITWAHFSDIVRTSLLAQYGGLWLDATVWVPCKLPMESLCQYRVFSANGKVDVTSRSICFWTSFNANWSTWCMFSSEKNNIMFSFVSDMLQAIAEKSKAWPDYVIQDYLIYYAYRFLPEVGEQLQQAATWSCAKRNFLATIMNQEFKCAEYDELCSSDYFFKLSFRSVWKTQTRDGKMTYYGYVTGSITKV